MSKTLDIIDFLRNLKLDEFRYEFLCSQLDPKIGNRNLRRYLNYLNREPIYSSSCFADRIATVLYFMVKKGGMEANKDFFDSSMAIIIQTVESRMYGYDMYEFFSKVIFKMNSFAHKKTFSVEDMYFDEGRFYLTWNYIEFEDLRVIFRHPKHIHNKFTFATVKSKEVYSSIEKSFFDKLPPIYVDSACGKIVDVLASVEFNHCLDMVAMKYENPAADIDAIDEKVRQSFRSRLKPCEQKFEESHSFYLPFLQKIILGPCYECVEMKSVYTSIVSDREKAYLFVHTFDNGNHIMVFENENVDNSTIVFLVEKESKEIALEAIIEYFASFRRNKREKLMQSYNIFRNYGVMETKRIMHTDQVSWVTSVADEMNKIK